ncbi:hypothetical protein Mycsm_07060 (plasmid) [Mycobacterium sp. JS623]|uniref:hypothetical protein n=1 Tax=Mycobacterium sp. JS623 TaxID=212767 RepID=UPI0002A594BD|nr:hypothetical protein [Mycobacterium sp. JS623]AGB27157.1 hypothetical protein Mycsm_07060 [Mycobacterium sp. JS623]
MAQKGDLPLDPADITTAHAKRIHSQVDQFLTDRTLSPEDEYAAMNSLLNEVLPAPAPPPPPPIERPAPELEDWARDDPRPAQTEPSPQASVAAPWTPVGGAEGGGGKVTPAFPDPPVWLPDDDGAGVPATVDEDRYALWHPPQPDELTVPDDVADIAPVNDPLPTPPTPTAPLGEPIPATAPWDVQPARQRGRSLATMWGSLPGWARIAAPVAAVLVTALAGALVIGGGHDSAPLDAPPLTAEAPPPPTTAPADTPLLPQNVTADCPAGSSDNPGLIFGSDKSQAWICTRIYGVDNGVLTIEFKEPVVVSAITIVPGFDYVEPNGEDHWNEHRLVTQILWRIGGTQIVQKINPTRGGATLTIPNIATQIITATIQKTERPPAVPNQGGSLPGILGGPDAGQVDGSFAVGHLSIIGRPAGGTA